jgi:hypothetical protein
VEAVWLNFLSIFIFLRPSSGVVSGSHSYLASLGLGAQDYFFPSTFSSLWDT